MPWTPFFVSLSHFLVIKLLGIHFNSFYLITQTMEEMLFYESGSAAYAGNKQTIRLRVIFVNITLIITRNVRFSSILSKL